MHVICCNALSYCTHVWEHTIQRTSVTHKGTSMLVRTTHFEISLILGCESYIAIVNLTDLVIAKNFSGDSETSLMLLTDMIFQFWTYSYCMESYCMDNYCNYACICFLICWNIKCSFRCSFRSFEVAFVVRAIHMYGHLYSTLQERHDSAIVSTVIVWSCKLGLVLQNNLAHQRA